MMRAAWQGLLGAAALVLLVVLAACNLHWGDLNQDEGWYLYAAGLVRDGLVPYRDFAFTQGPVLPYVYAFAYRWVDRWGVAGGRLLTAMLGALSALVAAWLAGRLAAPGRRFPAAVLALILIAGNVYQSYFTTVVKTYALSALGLTAGAVALSYCAGRVRAAAAFAAGVLRALAAGTRLSAGVALPVAGIFLLAQRRKIGDAPWLAFGIGGAMTLLGLAAPFAWAAPDGLRFGLLEYHSARAPGTLFQLLVHKAGFVSRVVQAYFFPLALGLGLAAWRCLVPAARGAPAAAPGVPDRFAPVLWISVALITLTHLSAPFPYDDYQAMVFPLFAAALAGALVRGLAERTAEPGGDPRMAWLLLWALLGSASSAFSSPVNQDWFVLGRDRIWWRLKQEPALARIRNVGAWLGKKSRVNDTLLTQDTYLAVEARLPVPRGMELGPFCYYPEMPTGRARRLNVLNRDLLIEQLDRAPASFAAFSGYGLAIRSPGVTPLAEDEQAELWEAVRRRYVEFCQLPDFGQGHTLLRLFRRIPAPTEAPP